MMNLALWLKENGFPCRSGSGVLSLPHGLCHRHVSLRKESHLHRVSYKSEEVRGAQGGRQRKVAQGILRYHDPDNWPMIREALKAMGKAHLIGYGKKHLVPQPNRSITTATKAPNQNPQGIVRDGHIADQHQGLPPEKSHCRNGSIYLRRPGHLPRYSGFLRALGGS